LLSALIHLLLAVHSRALQQVELRRPCSHRDREVATYSGEGETQAAGLCDDSRWSPAAGAGETPQIPEFLR